MQPLHTTATCKFSGDALLFSRVGVSDSTKTNLYLVLIKKFLKNTEQFCVRYLAEMVHSSALHDDACEFAAEVVNCVDRPTAADQLLLVTSRNQTSTQQVQ